MTINQKQAAAKKERVEGRNKREGERAVCQNAASATERGKGWRGAPSMIA